MIKYKICTCGAKLAYRKGTRYIMCPWCKQIFLYCKAGEDIKVKKV